MKYTAKSDKIHNTKGGKIYDNTKIYDDWRIVVSGFAIIKERLKRKGERLSNVSRPSAAAAAIWNPRTFERVADTGKSHCVDLVEEK